MQVWNGFDGVLVIAVTVFGAAIFLFVLQRFWPCELRRQHNDLIGWHISVLGSTYAVIVGFMLFAVWTNFQTADSNAEAEANCLINMVRYSRGLSAAPRNEALHLARRYVDVMLADEWPAMREGRLSKASGIVVNDLWNLMARTETSGGREQVSLDHTLGELGRMAEFRRLRQMQVNAALPHILWLVLILGATVTIVSACLFGSSQFRLHLMQVVMLSLMISAVLAAIADINQPFQGAVYVRAVGFERAQAVLAGM